jgi:PAS domain S-box-containing protein
VPDETAELAAGGDDIMSEPEERRLLLKYLDSVVDNLPIMLFIKRAEDLRFVLWNKAGAELLGVTREELRGRNDYDFFPKEQADHFVGMDRAVLASGKLAAVEEPIATRGGERLLFTKKIPIVDDDGQPVFLLGISEDITEQKRVQRELLEAKAAAEAASRAKSEFLANVSHELRTPLTLILGPLETLLARKDLDAEVHGALARLRRNAGRLALLVNDVLEFAKLEAGKVEAQLRPEPVAEIVEQVLDDARPAAEGRGLTLELTTDPELRTAPLDRRMFEKILINLVGNALKFTPAGGRIDVSLQADDEHLELSVADTGVGIPADKIGLLFQRFEQVDASSTRKYEGTGLGLALVKGLAEQLGGTVGVESELGRGSRFTVRLPRDPDRASMRHPDAGTSAGTSQGAFDWAPQPSLAPLDPERYGIKPRLVIAEDNADLLAYLAELLAPEYDIVGVGDGRKALEEARRALPDAILSDVMMPEMDGIALVHALKADEALKQVPIILLTARAGPESIASGLDHGADDYLAKPFSAAELLARLRAARRMHQMSQQLALTLSELMETRAEVILVERLRLLRQPRPAARMDLVALIASARLDLPAPVPALETEGRGPIDALVAEDDLRSALPLVVGHLSRPPSDVVLRVHRVDGRVCVTVEAPHRSAAPEALDRVFEPVLLAEGEGGRLDTDLMLAQHLLRRSGADLRAVALPGGGMGLRFLFRCDDAGLPRAAPHRPGPNGELPRAALPAQGPEGEGSPPSAPPDNLE